MDRTMRVVVIAAALVTFFAAPAGAGGQITDANKGLFPADAIMRWRLMPIPGASLTLPTQPQCSKFRKAKIVATKYQTDFAVLAAQSFDGSRYLFSSARVFPKIKYAADFIHAFKSTVPYEGCLTAQYTVPGVGQSTIDVSRVHLKIKGAATVVAYRVDATYPQAPVHQHVSAFVLFGRYDNLVTDLSFRAPTQGFGADVKYVEQEQRALVKQLG